MLLGKNHPGWFVLWIHVKIIPTYKNRIILSWNDYELWCVLLSQIWLRSKRGFIMRFQASISVVKIQGKVKAELSFWLRKTRLAQFSNPKLINSNPKVILHLLTNTIALCLFVCLYVYMCFFGKKVKILYRYPVKWSQQSFPGGLISTIWNAIKPFPPEGGKTCFLLSYLTVLSTLTEFHLSCCLFYFLKHLLEANGQGDNFYQGKRKIQQMTCLSKIRKQEEHVGIPSVMYFLSFKSLPFTQLSHTKAIKNNRHCNLALSKYRINLGLSPLLP